MIGFDLSLTAPAACYLPNDWVPGDWAAAQVYHIAPRAPKNDDLRAQMSRYAEISEWAVQLAARHGISITGVWIEGYAFNMNNSQASRLMELGGAVRVALYSRLGLLSQTIAPSAARKVFFGNRKLPKSNVKQAVQLALFNEAGAPKTWTEDEADAFICCNAGLSRVGGLPLILE